ncbi:hypothetical protein [Brevibacillus massiliensis]|nr:hypothetical protein [Brevibacillus massiliensis]
MTWKLSQADKWLLAEIATELEERFGVSKLKAEKLIKKSNVLPMLMQRADFVHHEGAESWADTIAMQNNLARRSEEGMNV